MLILSLLCGKIPLKQHSELPFSIVSPLPGWKLCSHVTVLLNHICPISKCLINRMLPVCMVKLLHQPATVSQSNLDVCDRLCVVEGHWCDGLSFVDCLILLKRGWSCHQLWGGTKVWVRMIRKRYKLTFFQAWIYLKKCHCETTETMLCFKIDVL